MTEEMIKCECCDELFSRDLYEKHWDARHDRENRKLDAIMLPVNNELGDEIVKAWLKLHMEWAQDAYDKAIHPEDRDAALADLHAFRQVLTYAGGGDD